MVWVAACHKVGGFSLPLVNNLHCHGKKVSMSCCCHVCSEFVLGVKIVFPKRGNVMLHLMSEVSIKSTHSSDSFD